MAPPPARFQRKAPQARSARRQSYRDFASIDSAPQAQDATLEACGTRLENVSALTSRASKLSRRGDEQSARRSRCRLTARETQALRIPRSTTRQSRNGSSWVYDRGAMAPCVDSESFLGRSCWLKVWNKSQGGEYSKFQALGGRHTRFVDLSAHPVETKFGRQRSSDDAENLNDERFRRRRLFPPKDSHDEQYAINNVADRRAAILRVISRRISNSRSPSQRLRLSGARRLARSRIAQQRQRADASLLAEERSG